MRKTEERLQSMAWIEELLSDELVSLEILGIDHSSVTKKFRVECRAEWTEGEVVRYDGDTLHGCFRQAVKFRRQCRGTNWQSLEKPEGEKSHSEIHPTDPGEDL